MEKRITLTEEEIKVIKKYLKGKITMFGTSEKDMKTMIPVIDKAEKLELETNADSGDDLIRWYWRLYKEQEEQTNGEDKQE